MFNEKMKRHLKRNAMIGTAAASLLGSLAPFSASVVQAEDLEVDAEASITVDFDTGQILQGQAIDEPLGIASMTKMIAEYILFQEIEAGNISWDTEVEISDYAYQISQNYALSNVPLRNDGTTYTVEELYEALAIYSANGATIALAEAISGSEPAFVDRMQETVESFGVTDAFLVNSTGLNNSDLQGNIYPGSEETDENMMSARSSAIVADRILRDYPEILDVASIPTKTFREDTVDAVDMINWNWMLPGMINERENVDGLKTGTTIFAGSTFTGTAEEDGRRLITVVLNSGDDKTTRFVETDKMMDFGFSQWEMQNVTDHWDTAIEYEPLTVANGKEDAVNFEPSETLEMLVQLGDNVEEEVNYSIIWNPEIVSEDGVVEAPVAEGMELGELVVEYSGNDHGYLDEEKVTSVPLVTSEAVDKVGIFGQAWNWMASFFDSIVSRF